jgi:GAF domain-containing protein
MDQRSTVDHSSASPAVSSGLPSPNPNRAFTTSVSAAIAEANAHLAQLTEPDVPHPDEGGGHSLAEMAAKDLDAALQLLAERAQYITEATGAAIALRRGEHSDMLCRASAGSNAPELGALLSMEYGLSGESVRTGQTMHCEDAESDPRVNREGCRQLGIASVVVMPIVSEQQVLGVFELFSGKAHAFEQRDLSALQRLSSLVETAVKHAVAAQSVQSGGKISQDDEKLASAVGIEDEPATAESTPSETKEEKLQSQDDLVASDAKEELLRKSNSAAPEIETAVLTAVPENAEPKTTVPEGPKPEPAKKSFFWSAATPAQPVATPMQSANSEAVPPVLRNLQKCQACGFPVSQGRTLCVECEEKQWRGEAVAPPGNERESAAATAAAIAPQSELSAAVAPSVIAAPPAVESSPVPEKPADFAATDTSTLFTSSAAPSESWFAANKYILAALLMVALIIAVIVWMR